MSDEEIRHRLDFLLKSSASTQVGFDEHSLKDYPIMFEEVMKLIQQAKDDSFKLGVKITADILGAYLSTRDIESATKDLQDAVLKAKAIDKSKEPRYER